MPKDRMGILELENGDKLTCSRGTLWPPIDAIIYGDSHQARAYVTSRVYAAIRVWEQACGIKAMSLDKCPTCPYVLRNGELVVRPGGKGLKPQTTKATKVATQMAQKYRK